MLIELERQIDSGYYLRHGAFNNNFDNTLPEPTDSISFIAQNYESKQIKTDMTKDLANTEEYAKLIPLKRMGEAEDIAKAVKFLALDADYVTGQVLQVDGGLII